MATVSGHLQTEAGVHSQRAWSTFSESERRQMLKDDIQAGTTVSLILTAVILTGLVIGLIGVMMSLWPA